MDAGLRTLGRVRLSVTLLVLAAACGGPAPGPAPGPATSAVATEPERVESGLALGHLPVGEPAPEGLRETLVEAARRAQASGAGLFAPALAPLPRPLDLPLAGVALPMHHKDPTADYAWELAELADLGARWVNLLVVTRQRHVDSVEVPLVSDRTPSDERIVATIAAARELGLRVQLMPVVLIAEPGPRDWRGTLAPDDRAAWWRSYDRFLCHMADLAREGGADLLSVGSELASMEGDEQHWRELIANLRMRFAGSLTYSANWDHFADVPFWDALDLAEMTGYFEVCSETGFGSQIDRFPDRDACLRAGWRLARAELRHLEAVSDLPAVFSEVGIPSVEGALAEPWNYTLKGEPDPEAQRAAFEAFRAVFLPGGNPAPNFGGVFLYDYWGPGGLEDTSYTPRGKPAVEEWRALLGGLGGG